MIEQGLLLSGAFKFVFFLLHGGPEAIGCVSHKPQATSNSLSFKFHPFQMSRSKQHRVKKSAGICNSPSTTWKKQHDPWGGRDSWHQTGGTGQASSRNVALTARLVPCLSQSESNHRTVGDGGSGCRFHFPDDIM